MAYISGKVKLEVSQKKNDTDVPSVIDILFAESKTIKSNLDYK